jgi:hypothetical protein
MTLTVRIGSMMSPSEGTRERLTTVFTNRWFIAIMIRGREDGRLDAGHLRDAPGPRACGVDRHARFHVGLLAGARARARP